jgi:hypothetical protein
MEYSVVRCVGNATTLKFDAFFYRILNAFPPSIFKLLGDNFDHELKAKKFGQSIFINVSHVGTKCFSRGYNKIIVKIILKL